MGTRYCTKCGTANADDANFCFNCGEPITKIKSETPSVEKTVPVEKTTPVQESQRVDTTPSLPERSESASTKAPEPRSYNFIAKHWRGEYSLGVSYWLIGVLATILVAILSGAVILIQNALHLNTTQQGVLILSFYITIMAITMWQIVGIFRSASAHVARGGKQFWANAAQIMLFLGVIRLMYSFAVDGLPLIGESIKMISGTDRIPPYALRLMRNDTELELSGGIPIGTTDAVSKILDSAPTVQVIHLNNDGGRIAEASKLANLISQRQLITYTRTSCSSACALAFLGGRERYIGEQGRIGFHSASLNGSIGSADLDVNADFRRALERVGAAPQFIAKATSTTPQNMWFPSNEELKQQNVITSVVDSRYYGLSGVKNWRDANLIEQTLLKVPLYSALSTYDSTNYAKLRKIMVNGVQKGQSSLEIQNETRALVTTEIVPHYLKIAPDQAMLRYWRSQIAEMKHFSRTNAAHCVTFMGLDAKTSVAELTSTLPNELINEDLAALTEIIKQGSTNPESRKLVANYEADLERVLISMAKKDPKSVDVILAPEKYQSQPQRVCNSMIAMYDTILALPDQQKAANLLRAFVEAGMR